MSISELRASVAKQKELGLDRLVLTMPCPSGLSERMSRRVRSPFGLCEWYPSARPEVIMIYPKVAQVERWIKKATTEEGRADAKDNG